jgi:DNA-directed RNA polymerase sigma subunit (sigma70/sigma32)
LSKGFEKALYDIDPVFLFPSEILRDVKLFLSEVNNLEEVSEQIAALNQHIEDFEKNMSILQSNCPDYTIIQQLRKMETCGDKKKIKSLLATVAEESPDVVLRGLAFMSLQKPTLPHWWKLF